MDIDSVIRAIDELRFRRTVNRPETYPSAARQDRFKGNRNIRRKINGLSEEPIYISNSFTVPLPKGIDVSEGDLSNLSGMIEGNGTDALAFYQPFHFFDDKSWGIFIKMIGIEYLVRRVFLPRLSTRQCRIGITVNDVDEEKTAPSAPPSTDALRQVAFAFLFCHEYFHFLTEIAASALEVAIGSTGPPYYYRYSRDVYSNPQKSPAEPLEEALANAYAYRGFHALSPLTRLVPGHKKNVGLALQRFMKNQPGSYSSFWKFQGQAFVDGLSMLGMQICSGLPAQAVSPPLELMFDWGPRPFWFHKVPVRFVF